MSLTLTPYSNSPGKFGPYGGQFVPETLMPALDELVAAYNEAQADRSFQCEFHHLLATYVGRPTPLTHAKRLSKQLGGAQIYLKREDLAHSGAHKINNALGQALLAKRMGKKRIIAETGAGQHGVATATACALLGLECVVYMGTVDMARQQPNVFRMKLLGAEVRGVESGTKTLKDAINEAIRDWVTNVGNTYYLLGSALGPHPYPTMVRDFQSIIGREARAQILEQVGRLPDTLIACVGGGSNAIGLFHDFIADENVVFTNILSGSVHYTLQQALRFEQAALLRQQWAVNGQGIVLHIPTSTSTAAVQLRPDYLATPALADIRVRRAVAHAIDRAGLLDGLFDGQGPIVATFVGQEEPFYAAVDRVLVKYSYDPRRAEAIMNEVGYRKDRDGFFADETGDRFQTSFWVTAGTQTERLMALITDTWQRAGFDVRPRVIPAAEARDNQARSTFPGILNYGISPSTVAAVESLTRAQIGTAANRWGGQNRGGWANPDYNRVFDAFENALDRGERIQRLADLARIISEDLPTYPLFSNLGAITHLSVLKGPEVGTPDTLIHWNVHEWELR